MGSKRKKKKRKRNKQLPANGSNHLKQSPSGRTRATGYPKASDVDGFSDKEIALMMAYGFMWYGSADMKDIRPVADSIFGSGYYCVGDGKKAA